MPTRNVDVAAIRRFGVDCATNEGPGSAKDARSVRTRATDIGLETSILRTPLNAVSTARIRIRGHTVRDPGLDHNTAPTEDEDAAHVGRQEGRG